MTPFLPFSSLSLYFAELHAFGLILISCVRLVREALRTLHPNLKQGFHMVVILRGGVTELPNFDVALASMERIARRARLFVEPAPDQPA